MKVRIRFEKTGPVRFVGHLDFMRCFQKILKRSELAPVYSSGFNPHIVMSFAAPLGVGEETLGDYADVEFAYRDHHELSEQEAYRLSNIGLDNEMLPDPPCSEEFLKLFNDVCPEGVKASAATRVGLIKSSKAMALVRYASFLVILKDGFMPQTDEEFREAVEHFSSKEQIVIHKVTKKSEKDVDIRPLIVSVKAYEGEKPAFVFGDEFRNARILELTCAQGSSENLKPGAVMKAFCEEIGAEFDPCGFRVVRTELMNEELLPLSKLGSDF